MQSGINCRDDFKSLFTMYSIQMGGDGYASEKKNIVATNLYYKRISISQHHHHPPTDPAALMQLPNTPKKPSHLI